MRSRKDWTEEERLWARNGMILIIAVMAILFVSSESLRHLFGTSGILPGTLSLLAGIRVIVGFYCATTLFPCSVLAEFTYSRIKKRSFRPVNVVLFLLLLGGWFLLVFALLTLFDVLFWNQSVLIQVPIASVAVSVPTLAVAAGYRTKRVREYYRKAFD